MAGEALLSATDELTARANSYLFDAIFTDLENAADVITIGTPFIYGMCMRSARLDMEVESLRRELHRERKHARRQRRRDKRFADMALATFAKYEQMLADARALMTAPPDTVPSDWHEDH